MSPYFSIFTMNVLVKFLNCKFHIAYLPNKLMRKPIFLITLFGDQSNCKFHTAHNSNVFVCLFGWETEAVSFLLGSDWWLWIKLSKLYYLSSFLRIVFTFFHIYLYRYNNPSGKQNAYASEMHTNFADQSSINELEKGANFFITLGPKKVKTVLLINLLL